ncbi:MAG: preprotein translocase subunit SecE [Candidatus Nomurabacteria bacterium]|nr:preprotein translocase subunit SecE [Candidatus Saccharibacteria bacterium]USN95502.1 MAG: preprotein translocase subunit SecE [Candidatus Nomurabacteria bacterium]
MARTRKLPSKKSKKSPRFKKPTAVGNFFSKIWSVIKKLFRPFRFLLKPFKLRPVRFIGRVLRKILLIDYFIASWRELKLVSWPGRKETFQLTIAVFVFAIGFGVFIAIVDFGLSKLFQEVLLK